MESINIADNIIKSAMFISGICTLNIYNYKKVLNYLDINNFKYIYIQKKLKLFLNLIARVKPSFYFVKIFTLFKMSIYVK